MNKINLGQFKFKRKSWRCLCPQYKNTWYWETTKLADKKEPLDAICPKCLDGVYKEK